MPSLKETPSHLRIDKWLWAARFYKTRALATQAIHAGHVRLNGSATKAAREIRPGDLIDLKLGRQQWTIRVLLPGEQRLPACEARQLYEETSESHTRRMAAEENLRLAAPLGSDLRGRPTKKARRQIRGIHDAY